MLVLSRKTDESILIGGNIIVKVSHIHGSRVQIAIEAPPDVSIRRSELVNAVNALAVETPSAREPDASALPA